MKRPKIGKNRKFITISTALIRVRPVIAMVVFATLAIFSTLDSISLADGISDKPGNDKTPSRAIEEKDKQRHSSILPQTRPSICPVCSTNRTQLSSSPGNEKNKTSPSTPVSDPVKRQILEEIQSIRSRLGGGLSRQLNGIEKSLDFSIVEQDPQTSKHAIVPQRPDAVFACQLNNVMSNKSLRRPDQRAQRPDRQPPETEYTEFSNDPAAKMHADHPTGRQLRSQIHNTPLPMAQARFQDALARQRIRNADSASRRNSAEMLAQKKLRQCARQIEEVASQLEQLEIYDQADLLRGEARTLWKKARSVN